MYHLATFAYCGMRCPHVDTADRAEARTEAAALIRRRRRQGFTVATRKRGQSWEVLEPEGAAMVPDQCGVISLTRDTFECRECGTLHDTAADARECCTAVWDDPERDRAEELHNAELLREG